MANKTINSEDLDGVRAIGIPRAARMYDMTKNTMRKILKEAKVLIERWRRHYNTVRPHQSLGYRPPAPEAIVFPNYNRTINCEGSALTLPASSPPPDKNGSYSLWRWNARAH